MRIKSLHKLLLVAVLAFGQWLMVAHDYQHPALGDGEQSCQVCLHGQNLQAGPATAPTLAGNWLSSEAPLVSRADPVLVHRYTHASIRAPPTFLV